MKSKNTEVLLPPSPSETLRSTRVYLMAMSLNAAGHACSRPTANLERRFLLNTCNRVLPPSLHRNLYLHFKERCETAVVSVLQPYPKWRMISPHAIPTGENSSTEGCHFHPRQKDKTYSSSH